MERGALAQTDPLLKKPPDLTVVLLAADTELFVFVRESCG